MKILHIAPFNTSDVPMTLVRAERALGHESRLVTLAPDRRGYEEDICLHLPWLDVPAVQMVKRLVSHPDKLRVDSTFRQPDKIPVVWQANGFVESSLIRFRELIWSSKIAKAITRYGLDNFDLYQLDGGLEFTRDGRFIAGQKRQGKTIICCYTGSDLRTRGVMSSIDSLADLNVTVEFDHLHLHPRIHHVFFPFEVEKFTPREKEDEFPVKIGHAPTVRRAKKSDTIISVVKSLSAEYDIELILIENLSYKEALHRKSQCAIFIDQLGDLGYGINALEALAMAIPSCTCLAAGFAERCPDHPFVEVNEHTLRDKLIMLIKDCELRRELGMKGRAWLSKYHDSKQVVRKIHSLAGLDR